LDTTDITYIANNPQGVPGLQVYCGRTSGFGSSSDILGRRLRTHHAIEKGIDVDIDKEAWSYPSGYWAIRGREQQNIDFYGGAIRDPQRLLRINPNCANDIRGVAITNPGGKVYHLLSSSLWGELYPFTGLEYDEYDDEIINWWETKRKYIKDWFKQ
jgi:hypothetical protein